MLSINFVNHLSHATLSLKTVNQFVTRRRSIRAVSQTRPGQRCPSVRHHWPSPAGRPAGSSRSRRGRRCQRTRGWCRARRRASTAWRRTWCCPARWRCRSTSTTRHVQPAALTTTTTTTSRRPTPGSRHHTLYTVRRKTLDTRLDAA